MKRIIALILLVVVVCFLFVGCQSGPEARAKQAMDNLFKPKDQKTVDAFNKAYNQTLYGIQAAENGDTYCVKCNKFIEGKVRICPYCGQYI